MRKYRVLLGCKWKVVMSCSQARPVSPEDHQGDASRFSFDPGMAYGSDAAPGTMSCWPVRVPDWYEGEILVYRGVT